MASRVLWDKRIVKVCICISILISISQIKKMGYNGRPYVDLLPALFFLICFSLYFSVVSLDAHDVSLVPSTQTRPEEGQG